jgi:hypothetical protein
MKNKKEATNKKKRGSKRKGREGDELIGAQKKRHRNERNGHVREETEVREE